MIEALLCEGQRTARVLNRTEATLLALSGQIERTAPWWDRKPPLVASPVREAAGRPTA